jgi:tetratricopeptide (TPR) repeat protein
MALVPCFAPGKSGKKPQKTNWAADADRRKADYIYMEAMKQNVLDNDDQYFELLQRSCALDTGETQPGMNLGYFYMALGQEDTLMANQGYQMMRRHFNAHPGDYYSSIFYGVVNNRLGNRREAIRVWSMMADSFPDKSDIALRLAEALQAQPDSSNLRRSISVLNRIERAEGKDLGLTSAKVRALLNLRDTAGVYHEIDNLLQSSRADASNTLYAGDVYMVLGQTDSALAYYNRACEIDPTNGMAYYKRAEYYQSRGDSVGYDREVFEALKQDGVDIETKLDIFTTYIRQLYTDSLQQPRIQELFDALLQQNPHEPKVRDLYTSYLAVRGDFGGAAEQQEYALDGDLSNESRWRTTVGLYNSAGNDEKALEVGERALTYLPQSAILMLYNANTLMHINRNDEAEVYLRRAIAAADTTDYTTLSSIYSSMGDLKYQAHELDSAFYYYDRAIKANPDNMLALNNCAYYMAEQGVDLDKAERMSSICVRQQPDSDTAIDTYAWILFKQKKYIKAKEWIDKAVALEGDDPQSDVLHHAGDIYYMNGEPDAAVEFWEQALKLDPDNALLKKKVKNRTHYFE